jgi:hypothetical protein
MDSNSSRSLSFEHKTLHEGESVVMLVSECAYLTVRHYESIVASSYA